MAIDSKDKRFSMLAFSDGALLPDSDGSFDSSDRAHWLWLYMGIALGVAEVGGDGGLSAMTGLSGLSGLVGEN